MSLGMQTAYAAPNLTKKWFPGHYLYADEKSFSQGLQERSVQLVRGNRNFAGYHVRYAWAALEPNKGVYDFSIIDRDLKTASSDGKKLIIHIHDRNHQKSSRLPVPEYLTKDPIYEGGVYWTSGSKIMPKLWVPAVTERYGELFKALGKAFDGNSTLAYVAIEETALPGAKDQPGFTSSKLANGYKTIYSAAAAGFPRTIFSQYANYRGGMTERDTDATMAHLVETTKNGFGGPDALRFGTGGSHGALDSQYGRYYTRYRGVAPITSSSQAPTYEANDALTVIKYATDELGAHFMSWAPITSGRKWTIYDVIKVLDAGKGTLNTTPPKNLGGSGGGDLSAPNNVRLTSSQ
jgi:hypothetical protein